MGSIQWRVLVVGATVAFGVACGGAGTPGQPQPTSVPTPVPALPPAPQKLSWCAALEQLKLPSEFTCLDLPGTRTVAGFGPASDPLRTTFDACLDDGALKTIFPNATPSGNYAASYTASAKVSGGASLGLGSLVPFLSGLSVSTSATSSDEVAVTVNFAEGAIRSVSNLALVFADASGTATQSLCKRQLCTTGAEAVDLTTRVFVAQPTVSITAGNDFEVKGEVKALSTFGVSGSTAKSSGRSLSLTASVPIILMYAHQAAPTVMGAACNLKLSGRVDVSKDTFYAANTIELDSADFHFTNGARLELSAQRLSVFGNNSFIGNGATGTNGTQGVDAFGPASSGGCKTSCDEVLWSDPIAPDVLRCPWNNRRAQRDFDESLSACNGCSACHCGTDGSPAGDGRAGPTVLFTVAEPMQRSGSISYSLDGGHAGVPGRPGFGMAISNHGGDKVRCSNGHPGANANAGQPGKCEMKIGSDAAIPCK